MYRIAQISKFSNFKSFQLARMMHSLIQNKAFINGAWTCAADNKNFEVTNPANQSVIGMVPDMSVKDTERAIDAAYDTFYSKAWQDTSAKDRSGLLEVSLTSCH